MTLPAQRVEGASAFDRVVTKTMAIGGVEVTAASLSTAGQLTVKNATVGNMTAGQLVYISGYDATAGCYTVTLADADGVLPADLVLMENINAGATGKAADEAVVTGLNTNARTVGDLVHLSGTAGGWVYSAPTGADQIVQVVGVVTIKSATVGAIRFFPGRRIIDKLGASALQPLSVLNTKLAGGFMKVTLVAGTNSAVNVTVAGMAAGDELVSVLAFATAASIATVADRTSEYVVGAGVLTKAAGTDERNNQLVIIWNDLTA